MELRRDYFVSIPTLLDPDLAPDGHHIIHTLPSWAADWRKVSVHEYDKRRKLLLDASLEWLEKNFSG